MKLIPTGKLADAVKDGKLNLRISQEQLSALTGIKEEVLSRIENNSYIPSREQLQSLADTLKLDANKLVDEIKGTVPAASETKSGSKFSFINPDEAALSLAVALAESSEVAVLSAGLDSKPIADYIASHINVQINLDLTSDMIEACSGAEYIVIPEASASVSDECLMAAPLAQVYIMCSGLPGCGNGFTAAFCPAQSTGYVITADEPDENMQSFIKAVKKVMGNMPVKPEIKLF